MYRVTSGVGESYFSLMETENTEAFLHRIPISTPWLEIVVFCELALAKLL